MELKKDRLIEILISSLQEILSEQDENGEIPLNNLNDSTLLLGKKAILDSLSLVSLIVDIEQKINEELGIDITIADERAMSQEKSPFRTIESLAQYIEILVDEQMKND